MTIWEIIWFALIAVLLVGYTVLDGFDLGVGFWSLFLRKEADRRGAIAAIAPFWDGNEVWLLTAAGATFAAFPPVYAAIFSGLYPALMTLLFALILRAAAIEFSGHAHGAAHGRWTAVFGVSSTLVIILLGAALGNLIHGLPLRADGEIVIGIPGILNPYAVLVGVLNLAMLATHGALYLRMRGEGEMRALAARWSGGAWVVYAILAVATGVITAFVNPAMLKKFLDTPLLWAAPALAIAGIAVTGLWLRRETVFPAFLASSVGIAGLLATAAVGLFPVMVPGLNPAYSLTAHNSANSTLTLQTMLVIVLIGVPIVLGYTIWVYRVFRGKADDMIQY